MQALRRGSGPRVRRRHRAAMARVPNLLGVSHLGVRHECKAPSIRSAFRGPDASGSPCFQPTAAKAALRSARNGYQVVGVCFSTVPILKRKEDNVRENRVDITEFESALAVLEPTD